MAGVKKNANQKTNTQKQPKRQQALVRVRRNWNPCTPLVGMQTGAATTENSMEVPRKI